ncbi:MAG: hypothetical protein ACPGIC_03980 [Opitutales bacterium]
MRPALGPLTAIALTTCFSGCLSTGPVTYISNLNLDSTPTIGDFEVCQSSGCRRTSRIGYAADEWQSIAAIFEPAAANSTEERERIKVAIGAMEQIIGTKNDTAHDAPKNQRKLGTGNQLDCIAEAANSTVALMLLQQEGLLRFHQVACPQHRGFIHMLYPHNAASIEDITTGEHYVIDSWFFAGGEPAIAVPVGKWKSGYNPYKDEHFTAPGAR